MMKILVVLCLVLGGMDALGEEMPKENEATKKEKASEQWYGIMAGQITVAYNRIKSYIIG